MNRENTVRKNMDKESKDLAKTVRCDLLIVRRVSGPLTKSLVPLIMEGSKKIEHFDISRIKRAMEVSNHLRPRVAIVEGPILTSKLMSVLTEKSLSGCRIGAIITMSTRSRKIISNLGIETCFKEPMSKEVLQDLDGWIRKDLPEPESKSK